MTLPKLRFNNKKETAITRFYGINKSNNIRDGELADSYGVSTSRYPTIVNRNSWTQMDTDVSDMFEWDNKLAVVKDGVLYFDGQAVTNVTPDEKHFCVVNTKLCVFPDQIYVDVTNGSFGHLDNRLQTSGEAGSIVIDDKSISAAVGQIVASNVVAQKSVTTAGTNLRLRVYGTDVDAVKACYHDGAWDLSALSPLEQVAGLFEEYKNETPSGCDLYLEEEGYIFIPKYTSNAYSPITAIDADPSTSEYNTQGFYAVLKQHTLPKLKVKTSVVMRSSYSVNSSQIESLSVGNIVTVLGHHTMPSGTPWVHIIHGSNEGYSNSEYFTKSGDISYKTSYWTFDVYNVYTGDVPLFSEKFMVNQAVDVTNTLYGLQDIEQKIITAVSDATITFADGTFRVPTYAALLGTARVGNLAFYNGTKYYEFTADQTIPKDHVLWIDADLNAVHQWNPTEKKEVKKFTATEKSSSSRTVITGTAYDTSSSIVTLRLTIPKFDHCCSYNNRLYAVSNEKMSIYVSANGQPGDFFSNALTADGAWSVAVASDNKFTAINAFNSCVYAWKEDMVYKVLGTNPTDFYFTEYKIAGVQEGSHRSLISINNVLYYKGVYGVYSFGGYTPQLISYNLGDKMYYHGVAGTDFRNYYLHLEDAEENHYLMSYDVTHGLWIIMDKFPVNAMTTVNNSIQVLTDGKIYAADGGPIGKEWMIETCPISDFTDKHPEYKFARKGLTKVLLYVDMSRDAHFEVFVNEDEEGWMKRGVVYEVSKLTHWIPIRLGRCNRFAIRMIGTGEVTIRGIKTESSLGSEVW